jgi:N-acetylated-alpha-linked acidic dipeptidase
MESTVRHAIVLSFLLHSVAFAIDEALIKSLNNSVSADKLREYHILLASEPHVAGTPGDERQIQRLMDAFSSMGLTPERHDFWPLLAAPISASLSIVTPDPLNLPLQERPLPEDKDSQHPELSFGWNAYSASGKVTAPVIYANFGREEDFEQLKSLGIDVSGKIVLARYGGNYRGFKAKFAEASGAAGLIIFSDPKDSGFTLGDVYPIGGYFNDCCIQRGSIVTLGYQGDPLTPGTPATENAERLPESQVPLPRIPVQPISYGAAREILSRMTGAEAPADWRGGLPLTYRIDGGADLTVRLNVQQKREIRKTSNVLATIRGSEFPDECIIIGAHHDAWNHGAADPTCGTIVVLEAARQFAALAAAGKPPVRTLIFAAWGAEEFGIIGSSEWVEANRDGLLKNAVAYLNLDMASMGPNFGASASPSLHACIQRVMKLVPVAGAKEGIMLGDINTEPPGTLGGGSDHVAFLCHAGIASAALGASGSKGSSYHSAYDTLPWYWKIVGADYASATMVTRMTCALTVYLAFDRVLPLNPCASFESAVAFEAPNQYPFDHSVLAPFTEVAQSARGVMSRLVRHRVFTEETTDEVRAINHRLLALDRVWLRDQGLPDRPWFRNFYVAPDENSGYASWLFPGVQAAKRRSPDLQKSVRVQYEQIAEDAARILSELRDIVDGPDPDFLPEEEPRP